MSMYDIFTIFRGYNFLVMNLTNKSNKVKSCTSFLVSLHNNHLLIVQTKNWIQ